MTSNLLLYRFQVAGNAVALARGERPTDFDGCQFNRTVPSVFVQIFPWNIVFWYFVRVHFLLVIVLSAFHAGYNVGFERVSFFDQLVYALRIRTFDVR